MNANTRYEIKALAFYKLHRMLAPGKDEAAASPSIHSYEDRLTTWNFWVERNQLIIKALLDAADEILKDEL